MSVLSQKEVIWNIRSEEEIACNEPIYKGLSRYIDIEEWTRRYYTFYKKWLYEDDSYIYDITSPINQDMLKAIIEYNRSSEDRIFLWFDVDRNIDEQFKWIYCPISKKKLIFLGESIHPNNRLVSPAYPISFPITL